MPPAGLGGTGCPQPQHLGLGPCPVSLPAPRGKLAVPRQGCRSLPSQGANPSLAENAQCDATVPHLEAAPAQEARCGLETAF